MDGLASALQIADWRRRVFDLYAEVRQLSEDDPAAGHRRWREQRDELFAKHPASPLLPEDRKSFSGLPVAVYDPSWRFSLEVEPPTQPRRLVVETGTDGLVPFDLLGTVQVPEVGSLDLWRLASYAGGLFLPVRDALGGAGTYGGGRYLLDTVKGAYLGPGAGSHTLIVDFNFAYNPSCAYDPIWACPLPQSGNKVAVPIPVGEQYDGPY